MYKVLPAKSFERDAKKLLKKYASLRKELSILGKELSQNPTIGKSLGKDCYKIRLGIRSKGKSGGARIITYIITENKEVILLTIYDKQVKPDISEKEITELLNELNL